MLINQKDDKNICLNCKSHIEKIKEKLNLSENEFKLLVKPRRVFTFHTPVKMDSGEIKYFNGYRVQYNDALGPTKGGIRFHPEVDLEEVETLAFLMSLKCSLTDLPFGGAKGGVEVSPEDLSFQELEKLSRAYIKEIHEFIGPQRDIPAPDVNTDEQIMDWMVDEYAKIKGRFIPAVITGKSIELGGSQGRGIATSLGGAYVLKRVLEIKKLNSKEMRVAIQGFGNVGGNLTKILDDWGYKIVAISDLKGGFFNENGLNIKNIFSSQEKKGFLPEIRQAQKISNKELLELDCDILVPAAISHQITKENADSIKAKIVLEMANAPTTPEADKILFEKDVLVVPDILANSGGVIVSYFEWVQNLTSVYWKENEVFEKLKEKITKSFDKIFSTCRGEKCDLREAAHIVAIRKILKAEKMRGNL